MPSPVRIHAILTLVDRPVRRPIAHGLAAFALGLTLGGCSVQKLATNALADALAEGGHVLSGDDDPELIRDALPFALKTIEILLDRSPDHPGLLLAACRGFVQYGYAFVELEAERVEYDDYRAAERLRARAQKLYLRGRDYCFRALDAIDGGASDRLRRDPDQALGSAVDTHLDVLYWTGASWGAAISSALDQPEMVVDLPAVRVLLERVLARDASYDDGAVHEAMITLEAVPEAMGGSAARARAHFEQAVKLSAGQRAGPFVTLAEKVAVAQQDRQLFLELLDRALAVDVDDRPAERLFNVVTQDRARLLRGRVDDLFFADE